MDQPSVGSGSIDRLAELAGGLDADALGREVRDGWSVAALLLHLAFWDRLTAARWRDALARGEPTPAPIEDGLVDVLNDALVRLLAAVPDAQAGATALAAAREVEAVVAGLPAETVEAVRTEGRTRLVDRSLHRSEHLDEIAGTLASD
jgi:hypothetical protein